MMRSICVLLALAASTSACHAEEVDADDVSLLPVIEEMRPAFECVEEKVASSDQLEIWKFGAPTGPAFSEAVAKDCVTLAGLTLSAPTKALSPESLDEFRWLIFRAWLLSAGDHRDHLKTSELDSALDFARCMETNLKKRPGFLSGNMEGLSSAEVAAMQACSTHPLSALARNYDDQTALPDNARMMIFANSIAGANMRFILEKKGKVPNEMRPCVYYGDGSRSIGCDLNGRPPRPIVAPPPPQD
jgi:hypothetical protein